MSVFQTLNGGLVDLIEGLGDPARRRRSALIFCLGYGVLWIIYGLIAKSSQDLNADMGEMIVWTRELALGYSKHPPLPAYLLWGWFSIFPLADWAYLLLAVITVSVGIFLAIELSAEWLAGEKLAAVPFLLAAIPFYNFLGLKFDQNSILIPLWALAMWAMMRALDTRHLGWAALAGLAAVAAMLSKYWSAFLILAMALAAFVHPKRRDYFRSAAPWVTAGVFLAASAPHLYWLVRENFPPITWVVTRRAAGSLVGTLRSMGEFYGGTFAYAGIAMGLVVCFVRPALAAVADSWKPPFDARRTAAVMFWTPLLAPSVPALIKKLTLISLWNTQSLNLLPVMMLASPLVVVSPAAVRRIAATITIITILVVIASPAIAYMLLKRGVENNAAYARLVMEAAEREWAKTTDRPLKLIAGSFVLTSSAAFYGKDKPVTFAGFSPYLSPWADEARRKREGMAIMCEVGEPVCAYYRDELVARNPGSRRAEVTLTRRWFGFENDPVRFDIAIIPPSP